MIKAILFDLWGTIIYADMKNPQLLAQKLLGWKNKTYEEFRQKFQQVFMTQEFKSLEEAFSNVCKEFGVKDTKIKEKLVSIWEEQRTKVKFYPESKHVLGHLKKNKYKLGLLSNASVDTKWILEDINISDIFDSIVLSCAIGFVKPDKRMYIDMLKKLHVNAENAVMVGDSYIDDVEGAEKLGIKGILFDKSNKYPTYPYRISSLEELEKFLH